MKTISSTLQVAVDQLTKISSSPDLDADILLCHILNTSRSFLHTWPEHQLSLEQASDFEKLLSRRLQGEPIAYIIGLQSFWLHDLVVSPDVLIPRPETELLVELALYKIKKENALVADLGVGSGAIALALAAMCEGWTIHATDKSKAALDIAKLNAKQNNLHQVVFHEGNWCDCLPEVLFDAIISNPPYIAPEDPHLRELRFEPQSALISENDGFSDLTIIVKDSRRFLKKNGLLLLEHGATQTKQLATILAEAGYTSITTYKDISNLDRVTIATWLGYTH